MAINDDDITVWNCPEAGCNGKLIRRKNKIDGSPFLGCTRFPKCRYTQKDESNSDEEGYPDGLADAASVWE